MVFQSTLSMRRATDGFRQGLWLDGISIHALHEESDHRTPTRTRLQNDFNPRSP